MLKMYDNIFKTYDTLKIIETNGIYSVCIGAKQFETLDPIKDIEVILRTKDINEKYYVMHSGGVAYNNKAILFSAPTNSGKSTAITFLANKGMTYISDDNIVIDISSKKVIPFYKPVLLRKSSMEILRRYGIDIPQRFRGEKDMQRIIWKPQKFIQQSLEIDKILIPKISDVNKIERLSKDATMNHLAMSAIKPYRPTTKIMKFLYKLSDMECFIIHFNDLDYIYRSICDKSFSCC